MNKKTSSAWKLISPLVILIFFLAGSNPITVRSQEGMRPVISYATRRDTTAPLRDLPMLPPLSENSEQAFERAPRLLPNRDANAGPKDLDRALQKAAPASSAATIGANFEGVSNADNTSLVLPPDTNGDIGPNHYVQMVNIAFAVYDRSGNLLYGPAGNNTLWQGFGGPCETSNDGDPVVLYDHLADRWMMSQFALPNFPNGPFYQCIAVSQTSDPTGAWYRYEFTINNTKLNDYPKFGVWPDGYYMSINQFNCNLFTCSWAGAGAVAFERDAMLTGGTARMVYFDLYGVDSNLGGMLPSDLDGPVPPAGAPNPFVQMDDNAWGYSGDQVQIWNFHVDWSDPSNATFTFDKALGVSAFDSDLCGYARNCIPQPGGANLDALSDRLMFRLQYRNFGSYQTLVVNHAVDANGSDRAGIRWYELRDSGAGWTVRQQGTYSPDSANRWVGSAAMNGAGDIGLGYSVSSASISPSIRFTGRLAGDTLGMMTQGEGTLISGSGYQTDSSGRWGDYAMLSVDPVDDCTFWFTSEYYASSSSRGWQTRIGSFKLANCEASGNLPPVITQPDDQNSAEGDSISLPIQATDPESQTITYGATNLPQGLSIDSGTGLISGTIGYSAAASSPYSVTVTADDGSGGTDSKDFQWTVTNTNRDPVAGAISDQNGVEGDAVSLQVTATDPDSDPLTYSATDLPNGLSIAASTGLISGMLSYNAHLDSPYSVIVTVEDGAGGSDSQTFQWKVTDANGPPVATNPGKQKDMSGDSISLQIQASDPDQGDTLVFSATGLPGGLNIAGATGRITGTLPDSAIGSHTVKVTATDKLGLSDSVTFTWEVKPLNHAPVVVSPGDQADPEGKPISLKIEASDIDGDSFTYSAKDLPGGLSIDKNTGKIRGVLSFESAASSPYHVIVDVEDDQGMAGSITFTWMVEDRMPLFLPMLRR